jgi:hypothetical protein
VFEDFSYSLGTRILGSSYSGFIIDSLAYLRIRHDSEATKNRETMEVKDIVTLTIATLALIVSFTSLWRAIRADRQSSKVAFEQKRQEAVELGLENQLSHEARLRKLSQLRAQVPASSYVNDSLDSFIDNFAKVAANRDYIQQGLRELPSVRLDSESAVALERFLGTNKQEKAYMPTWDRLVAEYIRQANEIMAIEAAGEEVNTDREGAEEEIQQKEEELRRLEEQLSERTRSADIPEDEDQYEEGDEDEDIPEDKPKRT